MPKADPDKERYWRAVIADSDASVLSRAEYCRQHDIDLLQFKNWLLRLRQRDAQPKKVETAKQRQVARAAPVNGQSGTTHSSAEFAEVRLIQSREEQLAANQPDNVPLEIIFPSGTKLRLASCPVNLLSSVLTLLEGR